MRRSVATISLATRRSALLLQHLPLDKITHVRVPGGVRHAVKLTQFIVVQFFQTQTEFEGVQRASLLRVFVSVSGEAIVATRRRISAAIHVFHQLFGVRALLERFILKVVGETFQRDVISREIRPHGVVNVRHVVLDADLCALSARRTHLEIHSSRTKSPPIASPDARIAPRRWLLRSSVPLRGRADASDARSVVHSSSASIERSNGVRRRRRCDRRAGVDVSEGHGGDVEDARVGRRGTTRGWTRDAERGDEWRIPPRWMACRRDDRRHTRARARAMTTDGAASATARRAYAVAHGWEHASALSAGQSAALGTVAQAVIGTKWRRDLARARVDARERNDGREMDRDARESEQAGERASTSEDEGGEGNLSSARAFYAWYASVEETVDDERRETHRRRADALRAEIERREAMLRRYDAVERGLATMAEKRAELKARSRRSKRRANA